MPTGADEVSEISEANASARRAFSSLDDDDNQRLNLAEFRRRGGDDRVLNRDFQLYDFDANDSLSRTEFRAVSGTTVPELRGRIPDPVDQLVEEAVAALDESYLRWNERPGELVNAHTFVGNFIASISPGGKRYVTGRILREADVDSDGRLSRAEAKGFIEHQLGKRWALGELLREPTGRLVRLGRFLIVDKDRSRGLSRQEFLSRNWDRENADKEFAWMDRNGDGTIHFQEFAHYSHSQNYFDPIEWFRAADTNYDTKLGAEELFAAVDDSQRFLVDNNLRAFDSDEDQRLSLEEYRLCMLAAVNYPWQNRPIDRDRDGRLGYDEFRFHEVDLFQLQRRYFFHRLDENGDGYLQSAEYNFLPSDPYAIRLLAVDGSQSRDLSSEMTFLDCQWPAVSFDGTWILFQAEIPGQDEADHGMKHRIVSASIDGKNLRPLCEGMKPSWAPDGNRFACERRGDDRGVWIMSADGLSGERIADGSAPRWSPDGRAIAMIVENGISIYSLDNHVTRVVLDRTEHKYADLGDDLAWSPDGGSLAFLASSGQRRELVILTLAGSGDDQQSRRRIRHVFKAPCGNDLHWSSDGRLIFSIADDSKHQFRLVQLRTEDDSDDSIVTPLAGLPPQTDGKSACVTPDGKWYIVVSGSRSD